MRATIHGYLPEGECELSRRTTECLIVTFEDGFPTEANLSVREFIKLIRLKAGQEKRFTSPTHTEADPR